MALCIVLLSLSDLMLGSTLFDGSSDVLSYTRYQNDRRDPTCIEDMKVAKADLIATRSVIIIGWY